MISERLTKRISLTLLLLGLVAFVHAILFTGANGTVIDLIANNLELEPEKSLLATENAQASEIRGRIEIDKNKVLYQIHKHFLSFGIDTAQLLGEMWWQEGKKELAKRQEFDLKRPALDQLVKALAPAYFRVGGTAADEVKIEQLSREKWTSLYNFTKRNGLDLVFTLGAGHHARDAEGSFKTQALKEFFDYTKQSGQSPSVWEFGNELNAYWVLQAPDKQIAPERYADDLGKVRTLLESSQNPGRLASQGSAFWPLLGEPLSFFYAYTPHVLQKAGDLVDIVTWHYYPQQSFRSPVASVRAGAMRLLQPARLDEVAHWASKMRTWRDAWAPGKQVWLGETGNAQSGGEPGVSDRFVSSLWWLDQLGLMAAHGMSVVVRHTLAGADYGLIDEVSLTPRPDYWASVLWKQLMQPQVLSAAFIPEPTSHLAGDQTKHLRVYAHKSEPSITRGSGQKVTRYSLLLLNISQTTIFKFYLPLGKDASMYSSWIGSDRELTSPNVLINGVQPSFDESGKALFAGSQSKNNDFSLSPLSYAFIIWEDLD